MMQEPEIVLIEPFYGGSHKSFMDLLNTLPKMKLVSMPAKKWHWRARTAALYLSETIEEVPSLKTLLASSVLNLCELVSLRPELARLRKVIYFHENQLIYPVQHYKDRDFQYGYNQILSCLIADVVVFNSKFNMDSFLGSMKTFLNAMPDHSPKSVTEKIRPKCRVLHFPIQFPSTEMVVAHSPVDCVPGNVLHILWPHRWEHDKNPELFFRVLTKLKSDGHPFEISVLGERRSEVPDIFEASKKCLKENIANWGYVHNRQDYYKILSSADVVVSTADHEFFGVAMLEAVHLGCVPLCPNRLVYPELYPAEYLYNTEQQLYKKLRRFTRLKQTGGLKRGTDIDTDKFSWSSLRSEYLDLLCDDPEIKMKF